MYCLFHHMNIHFISPDIHLQLNLSVCCREALNFAILSLQNYIISPGKRIKTGEWNRHDNSQYFIGNE